MVTTKKSLAAPTGGNPVKPSNTALTREQNQHKATLAKLTSMQFERDFWVEQARALQNQLQSVMRGQAAILNQLANSSMTNEDVKEHCNRMADEMRQPLTSVEAVRALTASVREGTQGHYTAVSTAKQKRIRK